MICGSRVVGRLTHDPVNSCAHLMPVCCLCARFPVLRRHADLNCGKVFDEGLGAAIAQAKTTQARLDASLELSMRLLMRAGYFDPVDIVPHASITPGIARIPPSVIDSRNMPSMRACAQAAA